MIINESGLFIGKRGHRVSEIHLFGGGELHSSPVFRPEEEYDGL